MLLLQEILWIHPVDLADLWAYLLYPLVGLTDPFNMGKQQASVDAASGRW